MEYELSCVIKYLKYKLKLVQSNIITIKIALIQISMPEVFNGCHKLG